jgi:hypothetical protein
MINESALKASLRASVTSRETFSRLSPEIARIYGAHCSIAAAGEIR